MHHCHAVRTGCSGAAAIPTLNPTFPRRTGLIPRTLFTAEHEAFRKTVRRFFAEEVVPHRDEWEAQQHVDRRIWNRAGELGLLCPTMPEEYGGMGVDRRFSIVLMEEQTLSGDSGIGFSVHSD